MRLHGNVSTAAALAVALTLTGCAGQQSDYDAGVADRLQTEVLEVSQLSASADYAGAMLALSELEVELKDALARGAITAERYESVIAALNLVRADLQAAIDAQAPPATVDPGTVGNGDEDDGNNGNGNGNGNGNNGNGNGNGNNGNGNGKDKDKDKGKD